VNAMNTMLLIPTLCLLLQYNYIINQYKEKKQIKYF